MLSCPMINGPHSTDYTFLARERSCICKLGISSLPLSEILTFVFLNVPTV